MSAPNSPAHQPVAASVRASRGIPNFVWGLMVLAAAIVFMQGAFVIHFSDYGRVWPSADSAKFPLDKPIPGR